MVGVIGMVVFPLWKTRRETSEYFKLRSRRRDRLKGMTLIFIESATLYTLSVAVSVIADLVRSNAYYPVTDVVRRFDRIYAFLRLLIRERDRACNSLESRSTSSLSGSGRACLRSRPLPLQRPCASLRCCLTKNPGTAQTPSELTSKRKALTRWYERVASEVRGGASSRLATRPFRFIIYL